MIQTTPPSLLPGQAFALLDDAQAAAPQSRLYSGLLNILHCDTALAWPEFIAELEKCLEQGCFAVSLLAYETGAQLQQITARENASPSRILIFKDCHHLTPA